MADAQRVYVVNHPKVVFTVTGLEVIGIMGTSYVIYRIYRGGVDGLVNDIKTIINITLPFLVKLVPQVINTVVILLASSIPEITQGFGVVIPVLVDSVFQSIPHLINGISDWITKILKSVIPLGSLGYEEEYGDTPEQYITNKNYTHHKNDDEKTRIFSGLPPSDLPTWLLPSYGPLGYTHFYFWWNKEAGNPRYHNPGHPEYKFYGAFSTPLGVLVRESNYREPDKPTPKPNPKPPTDDEKELKREQPFLRPDIPDEGGRFKDGVQILPIEFEDAPFVNPILEPYDPNKRAKNLDPENKRPIGDFSIFDIVLITGIIGLTLYYFTQ